MHFEAVQPRIDAGIDGTMVALQSALDALHGRRGQAAARAALEDLLGGVGYVGDFDYTQPMADFLLMERKLDALRQTVNTGVPEVAMQDPMLQLGAQTSPKARNGRPR